MGLRSSGRFTLTEQQGCRCIPCTRSTASPKHPMSSSHSPQTSSVAPLRAQHLPEGGGAVFGGVFCHLHLFIYRLRARRKAGPAKYLPAGSRSAASFTGFTASKALPQSLQISFHHFSCGLITRLAASAGLLSQVPLPLIAGIYYLNVSVCLLFPFWVR